VQHLEEALHGPSPSLAENGAGTEGQAPGKRADPTWSVRKLLGSTELHYFASPGYVARRGAPRVVGAPEHAWLIATPMRRLLEVPAGFEPNIEGNDFLFLREAARAGGGVAKLPSVLARAELASGALVRVLPQVAPRVGGMMLLYPATRPLARKISAFRDFLLEAVARGWPE
jgi:DNA-binding transcriptional LysR family regulator